MIRTPEHDVGRFAAALGRALVGEEPLASENPRIGYVDSLGAWFMGDAEDDEGLHWLRFKLFVGPAAVECYWHLSADTDRSYLRCKEAGDEDLLALSFERAFETVPVAPADIYTDAGPFPDGLELVELGGFPFPLPIEETAGLTGLSRDELVSCLDTRAQAFVGSRRDEAQALLVTWPDSAEAIGDLEIDGLAAEAYAARANGYALTSERIDACIYDTLADALKSEPERVQAFLGPEGAPHLVDESWLEPVDAVFAHDLELAERYAPVRVIFAEAFARHAPAGVTSATLEALEAQRARVARMLEIKAPPMIIEMDLGTYIQRLDEALKLV